MTKLLKNPEDILAVLDKLPSDGEESAEKAFGLLLDVESLILL